MASVFVASVGTAIAGAIAYGWSQKVNQTEKWDPNKFVIDEEQPFSAVPAVLLNQKKEEKVITPTKKQPVVLEKPKEDPQLSDAGMSVLSTITTRFGGVQLHKPTKVSFNTRQMEEPDQSRLNEFALQELKEMEFIVGIDKTFKCPFENMIQVLHQEPSVMIGATSPQMERVMQEKTGDVQGNIDKLKTLNGCTVNVKRIGQYVLTDHLPEGDGTVSQDGTKLILNKGFTLQGKKVVSLQSGDRIKLEPTMRTAGGEFSMYKCQQGTNRKNGNEDSYESCMMQRLEDFDVQREQQNDENIYLDRSGRDRFKNMMEKTFQKIDNVQPPPNMERADINCQDAARLTRDGFPQKRDIRSMMGGDVGQDNPINGARMNQFMVAADSHYGTNTKMTSGRRYDEVHANSAVANPLREQLKYERMNQAMGDIATSRPRDYTDLSGLKGNRQVYDPNAQTRNTEYKYVNDVPELTTDQLLNPTKRGQERGNHYNEYTQERAGNIRGDKTHRQANGYMEGGMVIHEVDSRAGGKEISQNNVRRKSKPHQDIYDQQHQAGKDDETTERNLKLYGVSKPVVKLVQLEHIPGVMPKRTVGDAIETNLYDTDRPHTINPRLDFLKDGASKRGVREDYGEFTNDFGVTDDPHQYNYHDNAEAARETTYEQEFGRQTGGEKANYTFMGENRNTTFSDYRYEEDPFAAGGKTVRKTNEDVQQRTDIYNFKQTKAEAARENSYRERMSNGKSTSFIRRGIDFAENPVTKDRVDADVAGEGKTARTSALYSQHNERDTMTLNEGAAAARENSYEAGIQTATGKLATVEQKMNMYDTTNATEDQHRRARNQLTEGTVTGMTENGYNIETQDGKIKAIKSKNMIGMIPVELNVGESHGNGTVTKKNEDGSYNLELQDGTTMTDVVIEQEVKKDIYSIGDKVKFSLMKENAVTHNRDILRTEPSRYDGVIRNQKVLGESMATMRNAEKGTEWFRNDSLVNRVEEGVIQHKLSQPKFEGLNHNIRTNDHNSLLATGMTTEPVKGEDPIQTKTINYTEPPGNLVHRPSFQDHAD